MPATTKDLLLNPQVFFQEQMAKEESLKIPAIIVLVLGIIASIASFLTMGPIFEIMPEEVASLSSILIALSMVTAIIFTFIIWIVLTVIFYALSAVFKGAGTFRRTLEFVGFGYIPQIIGSLITLPLTYSFFSGISLPPVEDPVLLQETITELMKSPTMLLVIGIGLLFWVWSANIWIFGIKEARSLSTRDAAITVVIPVGVYIVLQLANLVM